MYVNTERYRAAHGREPRGRGCWYFEFCVNGAYTEPVHVGGCANYGQAKAEAVRRARAAGATEVRVCS